MTKTQLQKRIARLEAKIKRAKKFTHPKHSHLYSTGMLCALHGEIRGMQSALRIFKRKAA